MTKINDILLKFYSKMNKPRENAGFLLRLFAFLIDFIILSVINYYLIMTFKLHVTVQSEIFHPIYLVSHPLSIVINWLYFSIMESNPNYQATIGKSVFKLKVVDMYNNKISFGRASGRFFAKFISCITLGIGFFMIGFTKNRQGLHDLAAGTFVKIRNY